MKDFTDITVILDRSGSMSGIKDATIKGYNDYINDQKNVPGDGCWSLIQFDDQYEVVYAGMHQHVVPLLTCTTFQPRGSTALVDAVCRAIEETKKRVDALPEERKPSRVLMVILTDGEENSSRVHTTDDLNRMISCQREAGWAFTFLGANQDAIATATKYGIPTRSAMNYTADKRGAARAFHANSRGTRNWKLEGNESAKDLILDPEDSVDTSASK